MVTTTEQIHTLENGETITIVRKDGRGHTYTIDGGEPMPSATSLISHVESDGFGVGVGWATKLIRLADGDLDAPKRATEDAIALGNTLHADIEAYVKDGTVSEENPAFVAWLKDVGSQWAWAATEMYLYHPVLRYGGTLDAISWGGRANPDAGWAEAGMALFIQSRKMAAGAAILWDWKTKSAETYWKYGGSMKDHAQVASYVMALREMGSAYAPEYANIAYVMRDGSGIDIVPVDIEAGMALFMMSRKMKALVGQYNDMAKPGTHE